MELTTAYWRRSISHLADFAKVLGPGESSFSEETMKKKARNILSVRLEHDVDEKCHG
jgi:hypothetical protein